MTKRKQSYTVRLYAPEYDTMDTVLQDAKLTKATISQTCLTRQQAIAICKSEKNGTKVTQYKLTITLDKVPARKPRPKVRAKKDV